MDISEQQTGKRPQPELRTFTTQVHEEEKSISLTT